MRYISERVVEKIETHFMLNNFPRQSRHYIYWVCLYSPLSYQARKSHLLCNWYCHLWPVRFHRILPHYLTSGTIFGKRYRT